MPYGLITLALVLLSVWIYFSGLPELEADPKGEGEAAQGESGTAGRPGSSAGKTHIFQFPHLLLGVLTLFLYVSVEGITGDTVLNYCASPRLHLSTATLFSS